MTYRGTRQGPGSGRSASPWPSPSPGLSGVRGRPATRSDSPPEQRPILLRVQASLVTWKDLSADLNRILYLHNQAVGSTHPHALENLLPPGSTPSPSTWTLTFKGRGTGAEDGIEYQLTSPWFTAGAQPEPWHNHVRATLGFFLRDSPPDNRPHFYTREGHRTRAQLALPAVDLAHVKKLAQAILWLDPGWPSPSGLYSNFTGSRHLAQKGRSPGSAVLWIERMNRIEDVVNAMTPRAGGPAVRFNLQGLLGQHPPVVEFAEASLRNDPRDMVMTGSFLVNLVKRTHHLPDYLRLIRFPAIAHTYLAFFAHDTQASPEQLRLKLKGLPLYRNNYDPLAPGIVPAAIPPLDPVTFATVTRIGFRHLDYLGWRLLPGKHYRIATKGDIWY